MFSFVQVIVIWAIKSKATGLSNMSVKTFGLSSKGLHQFMRVWLWRRLASHPRGFISPPGAISLSQLAVVPALSLHTTAFPKTLHALISASPWLPRHLEVIIQQSTPQSTISIMKHHILLQRPALCSRSSLQTSLFYHVAYFWPLTPSNPPISVFLFMASQDC